jgi:triosephosphate isomerase
VIAYEPVWAIGTGLTPTPSDVAEVHGFIRERLAVRFGAVGQGVRILYGGSVKAVERRRADDGRQCGRRAGRRCEPEGG